jgi:hypothetical protein
MRLSTRTRFIESSHLLGRLLVEVPKSVMGMTVRLVPAIVRMGSRVPALIEAAVVE